MKDYVYARQIRISKNQFQTNTMRDMVELITLKIKEMPANKKYLALQFSAKSDKVENGGVEPPALCMPCIRSSQLS